MITHPEKNISAGCRNLSKLKVDPVTCAIIKWYNTNAEIGAQNRTFDYATNLLINQHGSSILLNIPKQTVDVASVTVQYFPLCITIQPTVNRLLVPSFNKILEIKCTIRSLHQVK